VSHPQRYRRSPARLPNFESGILAEPLLAFGGHHEHVDPKTGLSLYGPYSLVGQARPTPSGVIVGTVGPASMIADAEGWLSACRGLLKNDGSQPFLYPHFPGFNPALPFQCDLVYGDTWREAIRSEAFKDVLGLANFYERVKRVVQLYVRAVEVLAGREPTPHVILCCIPQEVVDTCTVRRSKTGEERRIRITKSEKLAREAVSRGQGFLFAEMDPSLGVEDEESGHQNLRRGLKAESMQFGIPTQLIWPRTLRLVQGNAGPGERAVQDIATRAWNFTTALYHKAGGSPWRLAEIEEGTCFVGVSFYREILAANPRLRTSMAQAFTSAGDGYVLRGNSFEWDPTKQNSPHLNYGLAASLLSEVIDLYKRQNRDSLPRRIVVHKSSRFWEEELSGFEDACKSIPRKDFVAFGSRGLQFYRTGDYPALRGTYVRFSDSDLLLYASGYIPFLRTYPGARVPRPLEILQHVGDSPWNVVLQEILALTKMNWNTADFACRDPITLAFSRRVGEILAEVPTNSKIRHEYKFYM
jgi:hypothetical protein